jgi:hypothetical protein
MEIPYGPAPITATEAADPPGYPELSLIFRGIQFP